MRLRTAVAVTLSIATLAFADEPGTPTPPPDATPPPAAASTPPQAQTPAPSAHDPMAAPWSIGAGLGTTGVTVSSLSSLLGLGLTSASSTAPVASLTLERKLTLKTSLIGGLTMSANSTDSSPTGSTGGGSLSYATQAVALAFGVRHVFAGDPQLVAFSGDLALSFGYARSELVGSINLGSGPTDVHSVSNGGQLQLIGGFSVEHLLTQMLSLRINVRLVGAGFSAGRGVALANNTTSNTGFNVSIGVSPGLELRMYF